MNIGDRTPSEMAADIVIDVARRGRPMLAAPAATTAIDPA
jgi:hypothetical protein